MGNGVETLRVALSQGGNSDTRKYVTDKLNSAAWLIRSIEQRQRTIVKVTESICRFQKEFFEHGVNFLKPLILRDVADDIEMHESTVSRVTNSKYVHTPHGIFELKYFFSSHVSNHEGGEVSSTAIRALIRKFTGEENPRKPLSDQKLVELLAAQNVVVARRTVAKYRESLSIPSSSERKRVL